MLASSYCVHGRLFRAFSSLRVSSYSSWLDDCSFCPGTCLRAPPGAPTGPGLAGLSPKPGQAGRPLKQARPGPGPTGLLAWRGPSCPTGPVGPAGLHQSWPKFSEHPRNLLKVCINTPFFSNFPTIFQIIHLKSRVEVNFVTSFTSRYSKFVGYFFLVNFGLFFLEISCRSRSISRQT